MLIIHREEFQTPSKKLPQKIKKNKKNQKSNHIYKTHYLHLQQNYT